MEKELIMASIKKQIEQTANGKRMMQIVYGISALGIAVLTAIFLINYQISEDGWLIPIAIVSLSFLLMITYLSMKQDYDKLSKRYEKIYKNIESKTFEELTKKWENEDKVPLIKGEKGIYVLPGSEKYTEMDATQFFSTELDALISSCFPLEKPN